ncbi:14658_t:CDS:2 [Entrophospora sp. SA101]|nr:14658_t:CDS:2 [Entrophospora sp. SA101]
MVVIVMVSSNEFPRRVKSFVYRNVLNVDISQDTPDLSSYAISAITTRPPHVNYPSDISGSENINKFNNDENHIFIPDIRYATTGDFVGSAPVGAGRWSTLKRKKNNCYKNSSTIINNNDTEYDNELVLSKYLADNDDLIAWYYLLEGDPRKAQTFLQFLE